ncbi:EAL domain-containing protein [Pigmentiphaga soli]|uniref:EAL domain-containing protein n=1 Tax=Pigmentiphaga soli TaxID=1007095 RepID=UPI0031E755B4
MPRPDHPRHDHSLAIEDLKRLRGQGIKIGLDDFGTGHGSLPHLRQLSLDEVRLEREPRAASRGRRPRPGLSPVPAPLPRCRSGTAARSCRRSA